MYCRMYNSIPGLYTPGEPHTPSPPIVTPPQMSPDIAICPLGDTTIPKREARRYQGDREVLGIIQSVQPVM